MKPDLRRFPLFRISPFAALLACLCCLGLAACAGKSRSFTTESREYYGMKRGEILHVRTLDGKTHKVVYQFLTEDSLLARPTSFRMDSVQSIEKEEVAVGKTVALAGGVYVGATLVGILLAIGVFHIYAKAFSFLG